MNYKWITALVLGIWMMACTAFAVPADELKAAWDSRTDWTGRYTLTCDLKMTVFGKVSAKSVIDVDTLPFILRAQSDYSFGGKTKQQTTYAEQVGDSVRYYYQEDVQGRPAWHYMEWSLTKLAKEDAAEKAAAEWNFDAMVRSVEKIVDKSGEQVYAITFDGSKLYDALREAEKNGIPSELEGSLDAKERADAKKILRLLLDAWKDTDSVRAYVLVKDGTIREAQTELSGQANALIGIVGEVMDMDAKDQKVGGLLGAMLKTENMLVRIALDDKAETISVPAEVKEKATLVKEKPTKTEGSKSDKE